MKLKKIKTIGDFMLYCKMPYWYQSKIKEMKVGDILFLGQYRQSIDDAIGLDYYLAEAWIEKYHGFYGFYATWTIPTKEQRAFIMTSGKFKIIKNEICFIEGHHSDYDKSGIKQFSLVCRYLNWILKSLSKDECQQYFKQGTKPLLMGVHVNKDWIGYQQSVFHHDIQQRGYLNYKNYAPTPQLKAIVNASMALGLINF